MTPSFPCIKLYIPEMCCGAETALIEKDFKGSDLDKAVIAYSERNRRFGGV